MSPESERINIYKVKPLGMDKNGNPYKAIIVDDTRVMR
jgi:hypothetical protein